MVRSPLIQLRPQSEELRSVALSEMCRQSYSSRKPLHFGTFGACSNTERRSFLRAGSSRALRPLEPE